MFGFEEVKPSSLQTLEISLETNKLDKAKHKRPLYLHRYHHEHQTNNVWKKKATDSAENLVLFYCVQMRDLHPDLGSSSKEIDFYCE